MEKNRLTRSFRCLHLHTDAFFWQGVGRLERRDGYWVAKYPSNLGFYWGNALIFDEPPGPESIGQWPAMFAREFTEPEVRHLTFYWDDPSGQRGSASDFEARGYVIEDSDVLTASKVHPPPHPVEGLDIRPIESESDWNAISNCRVEHRDSQFEERSFREFMEAQHLDYRRMIASNQGSWYGAFMSGNLVADLGFFTDGRVGRFKDVFTHPDHRRKGICGALIYEISRRALAAGLERIVLVADHVNDRAARIYRSVGYSFEAKAVGMCRYPDAP